MAHFAELDENNVVFRVIVVNNEVLTDPQTGQEDEALGIAFCQSLYGPYTKWAQTSYNATFRKHYAGIGYTFDATLNAFIPPKPYPSWLLNTTTCDWEAPAPYPNDGKRYAWDETTQSWVEVQQ